MGDCIEKASRFDSDVRFTSDEMETYVSTTLCCENIYRALFWTNGTALSSLCFANSQTGSRAWPLSLEILICVAGLFGFRAVTSIVSGVVMKTAQL